MQTASEKKKSATLAYKKTPIVASEEVFPRYKWTIDKYCRIADLGFFDGRRVELIRGEIHEMAPMRTPHATAVRRLLDKLRRVFRAGFVIDSHLPMGLSPTNEPEPDVAVIAGEIRDFADSHPSTAVLVIEVSDSTLKFDRNAKAALYAEFGIEEYWIVNLKERQLEVFRKPSKRSAKVYYYAEQTIYREDQAVSALAKPKSKIKVADILP